MHTQLFAHLLGKSETAAQRSAATGQEWRYGVVRAEEKKMQ